MARNITDYPSDEAIGEKVFVYWNLHRNCWSVRSKRTGLVIAHTRNLDLVDATFKVSEAGRQRVLREKRKNVHAGVEGILDDGRFSSHVQLSQWRMSTGDDAVTYNPYKGPTFYRKGSEATVTESDYVQFMGKNVYA